MIDAPLQMIAYFGFLRETEVLGNGAGEMTCVECRGTGIEPLYPQFHEDERCMVCKGHRTILVSV